MSPGFIYGGMALGIVVLGAAASDVDFGSLLGSLVGRGRRVGPRTAINILGVVPQDPQQLADQAGLPLEVYALARMISSENGNDSPAIKLAIAWAALNHAGGADQVAAVLLRGRGSADGHFARQNAGGKYASTALDPFEDDVRIAQAVVSGSVPDPTGGATNFYSPRTQDALAARNVDGYGKDAAAVDAAWRASGLDPVDVPGVDPDYMRFYRRA